MRNSKVGEYMSTPLNYELIIRFLRGFKLVWFPHWLIAKGGGGPTQAIALRRAYPTLRFSHHAQRNFKGLPATPTS
jgi:hypothetical protein